MGSFTNGLLIGLGASLLFAPMKGEEMRRLVEQRINSLRGIPPENPALQQSVKQMADRVESVQETANRAAQSGTTAQTYAQQAATNANSVQSDLGNLAQQTGTETPQTRQQGKPQNQPRPNQPGSNSPRRP